MCSDSSRKEKRLRKVFMFNTFPHPDDALPFGGPFRKNILYFLQKFGEILDQIDGMSVWRIRLIHNNNDVSLYVIKEPTKECCDYCCQSGWSHHYITKKRYHLIIPQDDWKNKPLDSSIFDSQSNILYGFIHCNGFGHLICINGREATPEFVYDYDEIMDLWDRVCTHLDTRAITVQDPSWKRGLPVRFLYEIATGHPWFARWEYKFCKGSFGISESEYTAAINMVRSLELNDLPFQESDALVIISWYKTLDSSLNNLADLFKFMLTLKTQDPPARQVATDAEPWSFSRTSEKKKVQDYKDGWPKKKLERLVQFAKLVISEIKKRTAESGSCEQGMTSQQVWQAARVFFGDTALVDDVLKLLNNGIIGDDIVSCAVNPQTHRKEYIVREVNQNDGGVDLLALTAVKRRPIVPGDDIISDIDYLYNELRFCIDSKVVELAVKTIIETKLFIKEWPYVPKSGVLLRLSCLVRPTSEELEEKFTRGFPPGEHIVLYEYCTVGELKIYAQCGMRDTYHIMDRITITELEGETELDGAGRRDSIVYFGGECLLSRATNEPEFELRFKAIDFAFENELMYNGGKDRVIVKCKCGANDFDGEKMTECAECKIWQHTRCSGIDITERDSACISCLSVKLNEVLHLEDDISC